MPLRPACGEAAAPGRMSATESVDVAGGDAPIGAMKAYLLLVSLALTIPAAHAQERLLSTRTPCSRLAAAVASQGSAVISTSSTAYDRFVGDSSYCAVGEAPVPALVRSADNPSCFIGFRCGGLSRSGN
jgi:hypothetical protein